MMEHVEASCSREHPIHTLSCLSGTLNISQNLKSHAVTMFEVGKLSDETLDSFLAELEKVRNEDIDALNHEDPLFT